MISCCFLSIKSPPLGTTSPKKKRHLRIQLFGLLAIFLECDFPPKDDGKSVGICILKDESEGKDKVYGRTAAQKTTLFVDAMAGMARNHKILPALIEIQGSQIKCIVLAYKRWKKVLFSSEFKHWDHAICRRQMKPQT